MNRYFATLMLLAVATPALAQVPEAAQQGGVPAPEMTPPPPPASPGPPVETAPPLEQEQVSAPPASGQWVYTGQYGWVWMPYGAGYTYLPAGGSVPDMYVYYPSFGWCWVVAPWVWGLGPRPFFGVYGFARFGWYGRGFGHWYGYAPRYAGWGGRGYWGGGRWVAPHVAYSAPHVVARGGGFASGHHGGGFSGGHGGGGFSGGHGGGGWHGHR
jgi:hypothetical protein